MSTPTSRSADQAITIHLAIPETMRNDDSARDLIFVMEEEIMTALVDFPGAELDGDEWAAEEGVLFLNGPDADQLYEASFSIVKEWLNRYGGTIIKQYGPPDWRQEVQEFIA